MRSPTVIRHSLVALALSAAIVGAAPAGAASKPARDLVPAGASVLYFTSFATPAYGGSANRGTVTVTNPTVIAEIRGLINSLPVSDTSHMFCPDDLMVPSYVSFATNGSTAPFAKVLFQLGGCPFARVYLHGIGVSPTLGGPTLGAVFSHIKRLVDAQE